MINSDIDGHELFPEKKLNGSVIRAFDILEFLFSTGKSKSAIEISQKLKINKVTTYSLLKTLSARQYIEKNSIGKYQTTSKFYELGSLFVNRNPLVQCMKQYSIPFQKEYKNCRLSLATLGHSGNGINLCVLGINDTYFGTGSTFPLHASASGKVLLAYSDPQTRSYLLNIIKIAQYTPKTITDIAALEIELAKVIENGYGFVNGEFFSERTCFAAPIFGAEEELLATVAISMQITQFENYGADRIINDVKLLANRISYAMGRPLI